MLSPSQIQPVIAPAVATQFSLTPRSILIVDDECTLRSALRRFFMRRGWRVTEAEDGESARAILLDGEIAGTTFDAVLTDLRMPRMNGMELYDAVLRADAALARRFMFSSGDTGDDEAVAFIERTHCPVVSKPFELGQLLSMAEQLAGGDTRTN